MIRRGVVTDRSAAVALLRDFHAASGMPFDFSAAWAVGLYQAHIADADRTAIVLDVDGVARGILLAMAGDSPLGPFRIAQELAWWVDPDHRGASGSMLDSYEAWAAEKHCAFAGVASLAAFHRAERIYERRGYARAETHFIKAMPPAA